MPNATEVMPNVDLGREIETARTRLAELEKLNQERTAIDERIRMLVVNPMPSNTTTLKAIRKMVKKSKAGRVRFAKPLADVVYEGMVQKGADTQLTINEAIELAGEAGYKSTSNQPQTVFRQMLQRDKRFKKHHVKGDRQVRFGLSNS